MINVCILGSTGSIGMSALKLLRARPEVFRLVGVSAHKNHSGLGAIAHEFKPDFVHLMDQEAAETLNQSGIRTQHSMPSLLEYLASDKYDILLASMVGNIGLEPVLAALNAGKPVALANKETLVSGGHLVQKILKKNPKARIWPVDSEHSAIHQCLLAGNPKRVRRILLTASGGAFRKKTQAELKKVTLKEALVHPNWKMGPKITVDSSTLMNKGLEIIEAHWLFNLPFEKIEVVVHPQSIIHSMVEFEDLSVMAQLSNPDMIAPIAYALNKGERIELPELEPLDFTRLKQLDFERPDFERFPCLSLAYKAGMMGGSVPTVLNAANETAVESFLKEEISYTSIASINQEMINDHSPIQDPDLAAILSLDQETRIKTQERIQRMTA